MNDRNVGFYRLQGEEILEASTPHIPKPRGGYGGGGGYRGHGRGYVGRGRGPITCYNDGHQGHLARDFPAPPNVYFSYCKVKGHIMEDCPHLITKWKAKRPQTNNVLKILAGDREEHPTFAFIMRSGLKINNEVVEEVPVIELKKARGPHPPFNPQQEKLTFMEAMR